jgi:large subunit ribosomal protein L25
VAETRIPAEQRTEFGKGAARRIRREDKIPAVVYGHGEAPLHVTLPGHATMLALKHSNALLDLDLGDAQHLVLPKDVQRDPIRGTIEHVDLIVVRRGEKVTVDVPLHLTGEPAANTVVQQELTTVSVETEATHIPDAVEVSVEGLEAGTQIAASDVTLPEGTTLATDPETLVVVISAQATAEQAEAELEALEAEAGIVREESTSEEEPAAAAASDDSSDS